MPAFKPIFFEDVPACYVCEMKRRGQTAAFIDKWFSEAGFGQTEIFKAGHLIGRGIVP